MRILSMCSKILPCTLMAKLMNFLAEASFLNKTKRPRTKKLKLMTMTISCQCTFNWAEVEQGFILCGKRERTQVFSPKFDEKTYILFHYGRGKDIFFLLGWVKY